MLFVVAAAVSTTLLLLLLYTMVVSLIQLYSSCSIFLLYIKVASHDETFIKEEIQS